MTTIVEGNYKKLRKLVLKGITTKAALREAHEELAELIGELQAAADDLENGLCNWEDGDDAETRGEGKDQAEQVVNGVLDEALSEAGRCAGMADFELPDD